MCYKLMNLITGARSLTNSQKNFLIYMLKYADPDGSNVRPSTNRVAEDYSLTERGVIKMRNNVVRASLMICTKVATSRRPAEYRINVALLETLSKQPVDKSESRQIRGERSSDLGVNVVHPTYHIPINTIAAKAQPVDKSPYRPPIDSPVERSNVNYEVFSALKVVLNEKEGSPLYLEAERVLARYQDLDMAA